MADTKIDMPDAAPPTSDAGEFEATYAQHFTLVWSALRRFGVPTWLLEDATQDVFLIWYRQREQFRGESQVGTYLHAIARRVAANVRRTAWRTERRHQALTLHVERPPPDPEETVAQRQTAVSFARAVDGLPGKLREVYLLAVQDGLTAQQIALALGVSANTVSSRIRLSRARLAAELRLGPPGAGEPSAEARQRVWAVLIPLVSQLPTAPGPGRLAPLLALAVSVVLAVSIGVARGGSSHDEATPPTVTSAPRAAVPAPSAAPERPTLLPAKVAPRPRDIGDPLAREARILATAQRRLRDGDPDAALVQLRIHATRFAAGALAEERDALIAAALCQRGEVVAGRDAATQLAARAPTSAALATAWVACESAEKDRSQ